MGALRFFATTNQTPSVRWALSTYAGTVILVLNVVVRSGRFGVDKAALEWTRPLAEVVCVAGVTMTVMSFGQLTLVGRVASMVGHVLVGVSVVGVAVTAGGVLVGVAVLVAALLVYWALYCCDRSRWPYPLSPNELIGMCTSLMLLRLL